MPAVTVPKITDYIEQHIPEFHRKRLENLSALKLQKVLRRKNPYLFKAKFVTSAPELVKLVLDAHLSSQEETIFGSFLEGLAVFVCGHAFAGKKSGAEGIDLEFERDGIYFIVSIKSGPNWGNSGQIKKMQQNFAKAKRILGTNTSARNIVAVNGCCYGQEKTENKTDYVKKCGQSFWSFISGDDEFYTTIIEPLGHRAKDRNEEFLIEYGKVITRFSAEFAKDFCLPDGGIHWEKLVRFNSSIPS
ncbi:MAG: cytosolic protein [Verrucomicrobia bacterium]|nr:MAG: cytosolic protein [Verrucomicrobiota bacterium]